MELVSARRASDAVRATSHSKLTPEQLAWTAALPCGLLTAAVVLVLGPPLAELLPAAAAATSFWPETSLAPEPVEHARYGLALLGPLLLACVVAIGSGRIAIGPRLARALTLASQLALAVLLVVCVMAQNSLVWEASRRPSDPNRVFDPPLLATAVLVSIAIVLAARRWARAGELRLPRETRAVVVASLLVAAGLATIWLLSVVNVETTIAVAPANNLIPWDMDETFAVLGGGTPLVDFHAQYGQLLPFLAAGALKLLGTSVGAWTTAMATMSGLALLAVYSIFRRVTGHALFALALFVPFLAFGFYHRSVDIPDVAYTPAGIFSAWPMRYGGAYLLAWLTARHLDGAGPRRQVLLFCAGGLVAINNPEFGLGALAGTTLAVVCRAPLTMHDVRQTLTRIALGLLGAIALVAGLTLVRAGSLPHFGQALEFPHLYGVDGWVLEPMAPFGLHLAMYLTFAAATTLAIVRALQRSDQPVLTGMLMWSGVFGLGAGSYYLGRSDPLNLITLFSAWALALALLAIPVLRAVARSRSGLPTAAQLAVVLGCAVAICTLVQIPSPWGQVARLQRAGDPLYKQRPLMAFVDRMTAPGEAVAILMPLGHRLAYDLRIRNVAPYALPQAMPAKRQLTITMEAIRRAHVRTVVVAAEGVGANFLPTLKQAGFAMRAQEGPAVAMMLDGR
ncbi:MAG TPA: hypothetical protein VFG31_02690 [Conexibacter sp.]|nr:hypothetical protein [Conexibacter sp.]